MSRHHGVGGKSEYLASLMAMGAYASTPPTENWYSAAPGKYVYIVVMN